jgi:uncharacterized protein
MGRINPVRHLAQLTAKALVLLTLTQTGLPAWALSSSLNAFLFAARDNSPAIIAKMPALGLGTQTRDDLGNTLLMIAVREAGDQLALGLLAQPQWQAAQVLDAENRLGENALMLAALGDAPGISRRLLELGAQANRAGWGPLHYAATGGSVKVIQLLADVDAYVDALSPNGTTPLMMAARFNHRPAAAALLELGADPTISNQSGLTARDYAIENNNSALAFWLELEEISFRNRYLDRLSEQQLDQIFSPADPNKPADPIQSAPGVEVFEGIR